MNKNLIIIFLILAFSLVLISGKLLIKDETGFKYKINDSTEIIVKKVFDLKSEVPLYYYSKMNIPACNTGECMLMNITMYWDSYGNYFKYEVPQNFLLTKCSHKKFKKKDYIKLHKILNNPNSKYSKFTIENLTEKQAQNKYKTDATSGSTIKFVFDSERIKGAVKTTHTLWHIANGRINKILKNKTREVKVSDFTNKEFFISYEINKKEHKIFDTDFINKIEKQISKKNINQSILISNYLIRNNIKSKKSNKFLKQINFIKK